MKCPYQTVTIHEPETFARWATEYITFGDCLQHECPFYYTKIHDQEVATHITGHCKRAESEDKDEQ